MKFTEAFESLGYTVEIPRQDWSAISEAGVCITIWRSEMAWDQGLLWLDTRLHAGPHEDWRGKPGNMKRKKHLLEAVNKFGGKVDVVIVNGTPGQGYEDAHPWKESERQAHWQIESLDFETGHFSARVKRTSTTASPRGRD